jgi:hypothetical protein
MLEPLRGRGAALAAVAATALLLAGCKKKPPAANPAVEGNGVATTLERPVAPFTSLHVGGVIQATFAPGTPHLALHGDSNLLPLLEVDEASGDLWLKQPRTFNPKMTLRAEITGPTPTVIVADVASHLEVNGMSAERLQVRGAGAARLVITGSARELEVTAALASVIDLTHLSAAKARVVASTAARVDLGYVEELDVETRDRARVSYTGDPKLTRSVGRGAVKRR